jgi:hypothetical protein
MSLLSIKSIENTLEKAAEKGKNSNNKLTEKLFNDAMLSFSLTLAGCEIRSVYSILDPEGKGSVTIDAVMDFATKGKGHHDKRDRDGERYVL